MGGSFDKELISYFKEYIELLESCAINPYLKKDLSDAGLTPKMAKKLIKAIEPFTKLGVK